MPNPSKFRSKLDDNVVDGDPERAERTVEIRNAFDAQPVGLEAGAVLASRYQIEAAIGEGGSGQVFRAWDRVLGEPIALKILRPDRAREKSWIKRLAREVRVARAIRHANVCRVFDLANADGHWFVSMELATGGTLREALSSGASRPLAERLVDAHAICAGLAAIHLVGITHRDVTPQNVLRMGDGRLVLSDFGLASECADTTIEGGTPRYMPPETAMGQRSDQRSDVWQLGSILHELLFERRPEWERGPRGITLRPPNAPSGPHATSPSSFPSSFLEDLARLCCECLSQNPEERPATAMEVAARLTQAEVARPRGVFARLVGRRRGLAIVGLIVAVGTGLLLADAAIRHRISRRAKIGDLDRGLLRSLAGTLDAQGRHEEASRLNRIAAP